MRGQRAAEPGHEAVASEHPCEVGDAWAACVGWLLGQAEGPCPGITHLPAARGTPAWAPCGEGSGCSSSSGAECSGPRAAGVRVSRVPGDPRTLAAKVAPLAGAGLFLPEEASR